MTELADWRVVIVGSGLMGRWHAHAVQRIGGRVVAVVDPDERAGRALAAKYRCRWTTGLNEALQSVRSVHAVHVCSPTGTHVPLIAEALRAECHVLAEKPLAPSAPTTRELLDLARAQGRLLCPVHQFLFQDGIVAATARLPALGRIRHVDFVACSAGADNESEEGRRKLVREILPHPLALARRILGRLRSDPAWEIREPATGELRVTGSVDGVGVGILVSACGRPTRTTLRVICETGTVHADLFHGFAVFETGPATRAGKLARPFLLGTRTLATAGGNLLRRALRAEPAYPGLTALIGHFSRAAALGTAPPIPPEESLDVAEVWDLLVSRAPGKPVGPVG